MNFLNVNNYENNKNLSYRVLSEAERGDAQNILANKGIQNLINQHYIIPAWIKENMSEDKLSSIFLLEQEKPAMVSYPFEWSFEMLKDAALLFLDLVTECIKLKLTVTTGNANHIYYVNGKMQFNDILEMIDGYSNNLWPGYQQFLETFLWPLLFNSVFDLDFAIWWRGTLRGMSLREAKKLLAHDNQFTKIISELNLAITADYKSEITLENREDIINILENLSEFIKKLKKKYSPQELHWIDYQKNNDYTDPDLKAKEAFVVKGLKSLKAKRVIDLGANTGHYSKLLQDYAEHVIAVDCESACVDALYSSLKESQNTKITPMLCNMLNPSANLGYDLGEYENFFVRANADFFLALAVMHHITIPTHISLERFVKSLKRIAQAGIIEWISPEEEMSKKELSKARHRYKNYDWNTFVDLLKEDFQIMDTLKLHEDHRTLCLVGPKN